MNDDQSGADVKWDQIRVIWADIHENEAITQ